jgi:hypothetical protein
MTFAFSWIFFWWFMSDIDFAIGRNFCTHIARESHDFNHGLLAPNQETRDVHQLSYLGLQALPKSVKYKVYTTAVRNLVRWADIYEKCMTQDPKRANFYRELKFLEEAYACMVVGGMIHELGDSIPLEKLLLEIAVEQGRPRGEVASKVSGYYLTRYKKDGLPVAMALFDPKERGSHLQLTNAIFLHGNQQDLDAFIVLYERHKNELPKDEREQFVLDIKVTREKLKAKPK